MDKPISPNPIDALVARFRRKSLIEVEYVRGFVESCETRIEADRKVYVLHIVNGQKKHSFWLQHDYTDPYFYSPRAGDCVKGCINTLDDNYELGGESYRPIFDFVNLTPDSERANFAWFRNREEEEKRQAAHNNPGAPKPPGFSL